MKITSTLQETPFSKSMVKLEITNHIINALGTNAIATHQGLFLELQDSNGTMFTVQINPTIKKEPFDINQVIYENQMKLAKAQERERERQQKRYNEIYELAKLNNQLLTQCGFLKGYIIGNVDNDTLSTIENNIKALMQDQPKFMDVESGRDYFLTLSKLSKGVEKLK